MDNGVVIIQIMANGIISNQPPDWSIRQGVQEVIKDEF
jgi:hypothetical protein